MPKYRYHCMKCHDDFEIVHSMKERLSDCEKCEESDVLQRIPYVANVRLQNNQAGSVVREHIENTKREVAEEKKKLSKEEYK